MFNSLFTIPWPLLLSIITVVDGVLVNVTVDDSLPDPLTGRLITYLPEDGWKAGVTCEECTAKVDGGSMLDRTWHDSTYFPRNENPVNATFTFNGSVIYVFCALALSTSGPNGYSNMTFFIDNELAGQFERLPPGQRGYQYNVSVYANTSLPAGEHTFMIQNGVFGNLGNKSLALFDYLVYSYDDGKPALISPSTSTSSSSSRMGAIVGGVVGGIAGLSTLVLVIWLLKRRRPPTATTRKLNAKEFVFSPRSPAKNNTLPDPFTQSDPHPSATTSYPLTSVATSFGYGIGLSKNKSRTQQRYVTPGDMSNAPGSSVIPSSSGSPPASASLPGRPKPQRAMDAGPIVLGGQEDTDEEILPPEYGQVFANTSNRDRPSAANGQVKS